MMSQSSGRVLSPLPGLTCGCLYPCPADDRPGLDPAGWVLFQRPLEHLGLCGGGWCVGGLCSGVSDSILILFPFPHLFLETG